MGSMNTTIEAVPRPGAIEYPPEVRADMDIILRCLNERLPVPKDVAERMWARVEAIRQETFEKHGLLDIGVPAIRELRGELPE